MPKFNNAVVQAATKDKPPKHTLHPIVIGLHENARTINFPSFPDPDSDPITKKVALRQALAAIEPHVASVPSRTIFDALANTIPQDISAIDSEATMLCNTLRTAFLKPGHPNIHHKAIDFLNHLGTSTEATVNMADREKAAAKKEKCLQCVVVEATATELSAFHPSLHHIGNISGSFIMKLPTTSHLASNEARTIAPVRLNQTNDDTADTTTETEQNPTANTATPASQTTQLNVPSSMSSCVSPSTEGITFPNYYGPFTFLSSATLFEAEFGQNPPTTYTQTLLHNSTHSLQRTTTTDLLTEITRPCYFACLSYLLEADYIGASISNESATQAVFHQLRQITATRFNPTTRKTSHHSPTSIFRSFLELIPTLDSSTPAAIAAWPSSLAQQFLTNLPADIQNRIYTGRQAHTIRDHTRLRDIHSQLNELRQLCTAAQEIADDFTVMRQVCRTQVNAFTTQLQTPPPQQTAEPELPPRTPPPTKPKTPTFISPAESVLRQYMPQPTPPPDADFPIDPYSDAKYQSKFPRSFRGCYRCGIAHPKTATNEREHCPLRKDPTTRDGFFKEYFAHNPQKRRFYDNGSPVKRDAHDRIIYPPPPDVTTHVSTPAQTPPTKRTRFSHTLVSVARSFTTRHTKPLRQIPVAISPVLPTITLHLGEPNLPTTPLLHPLLDTCAGLNSGHLQFHLDFAAQHPECVAEFITFDDPSEPFQPICLTGAVSNPHSSDITEAVDLGLLSAVITYSLPYTFPDGGSVKLRIALGKDVTVPTILGWPFISCVHGLIDAAANSFLARKLDTSFPIIMENPSTHTPPTTASPNPTTPTTNINRPKIDNRPAWLAQTTPNNAATPATPSDELSRMIKTFHTQSRPSPLPDFHPAP